MKIASFLVILLAPLTLLAQSDRLISFHMEDQFRNEHTEKDFLGEIIILIGSDGGGSKYNGKWGNAIEKAIKESDYKHKIHWLPVADVSSAPFFMKGYVRSQFPEEKEKWAICDWDGVFAEEYDFQDDMSNILVFNPDGKLLYQCSGTEVDHRKVQEMVRIIKSN